MKVEAVLDKHLVIIVENQIGALAKVAEVISSAEINMIATSAYVSEGRGIIVLVTENNREARNLLRAEKFNVRDEEAILVSIENVSGALQTLLQRIANTGIDLKYLYGSVNKKAKMSRLVLVSEFNNVVLTAIKSL